MANQPEGDQAMSTPTATAGTGTTPTPSGTPLAAAQPQCSFMIPTGTENNGVKVTKQCVKHLKADGSPHDGEHSLRAYSKVDTSKIKLDGLKRETVPTSETVEGLTERTRDELQKSIDADVLDAHKQWSETGKKTGFNDIIKAGAGQRYFIEPDEAPAFRLLLKRAATFHTVNGTPIHVRVIPPKRHEDGRTMLYWAAVDKRESTKKDDKKETGKQDPTAATGKQDPTAATSDAGNAKAGPASLTPNVSTADKTPKPTPPKK